MLSSIFYQNVRFKYTAFRQKSGLLKSYAVHNMIITMLNEGDGKEMAKYLKKCQSMLNIKVLFVEAKPGYLTKRTLVVLSLFSLLLEE